MKWLFPRNIPSYEWLSNESFSMTGFDRGRSLLVSCKSYYLSWKYHLLIWIIFWKYPQFGVGLGSLIFWNRFNFHFRISSFLIYWRNKPEFRYCHSDEFPVSLCTFSYHLGWIYWAYNFKMLLNSQKCLPKCFEKWNFNDKISKNLTKSFKNSFFALEFWI